MKKVVETRSKCKAAGIPLLAILMLVLAALACGPGKPWSTAGASPPPQKGSKTYHFGDAVRVGDLVLTFELVETLEFEPDDDGTLPSDDDGTMSILILYTIENQGFETKSIIDVLNMMHLEDDVGQKYEPKRSNYSLLLPNQTKTGSLYFRVPADAEGVVLVIEADERIIIRPRNSQPGMLG